MKSRKLLFFPIFCGVVALSSCEKVVFDEVDNEEVTPTSQLIISTRADDPTTTAIQQGRIYIFDSEGSCVRMLSTDATTQTAETALQAGSFSVYAVGGSDLSRFGLPEQANATTTSVLQLQSGQTMGDLLLTNADVTLKDGENRTLNLTLNRKVFCVTDVTIKQVPADVTKVEVSLEPLYKQVLLNGTFPDETESATITLTAGEDGTWQAQPQRYCFPSKGKPTITVYFTRSSGVKSYSYTASEAIEPNHHMSIEGTYTESKGVTLTGILSGTAWGEDKTIAFNFDEQSASAGGNSGENTGGNTGDDSGNTGGGNTVSGDVPTAGSTYKGCYVVAVNGKTATLLSTTEEQTFNTSTSRPEESLALLQTALDSWPTIEGITGTWRIPTEAEARTFITDPNSSCIKDTSEGYYYIMVGDVLKSLEFSKNRTVDGISNEIGYGKRLRPVMDVTFE